MDFEKADIDGVWIITPKKFGDHRGYFMETWKQEEFDQHIPGIKFVQDNESHSSYGVLRGLHYQRNEWSQAKLVRVSSGCILDVIVDLRKDSPTFGKHLSVKLSDENNRQLWVPRGFAHGFVVLSEYATFQYKVDNFYHPEAEATLLYNDTNLNIDWRIPVSDIKLSNKDLKGLLLSETLPLVI